MKTHIIYFFLLSFILSGNLHAQNAGSPDNTFDQDGKLNTRPPANNGTARAVAIQADGKILAAGYSSNGSNIDFTIIRYNQDGSVDSSFNGTGILQIDFAGGDDIATSIAVRVSDQNIIIGGYAFDGAGFDFAVAQYNADGSPDANFGTNGKVTTSLGDMDFGNALAIQSDGKILLGGYSGQTHNEFAVVRYNTDGTWDSTFDGDAIVLTPVGESSSTAFGMTLQADNKIVLAGQTANDSTLRWEVAVTRYNTDGSLDTGFNTDGKVIITNGNLDHSMSAVAVQSDGKIVVAGYSGTTPSNNNFLLVRFHPDGRADSTFGTNGFLISPFSAQNNQITSLLIQPDDKMVAAGSNFVSNADQFALTRFEADGDIDTTFGTGGKVSTIIGTNDGIKALAFDADWKIVAVGSAFHGAGFDFAVARYLNDFTPIGIGNISANHYQLAIYPNPVNGVATLTFTLEKKETLTIELIDMQGRVVENFGKNEKMEAGNHSKQFSLRKSLPNGTYHILLSSESGQGVVQIVK